MVLGHDILMSDRTEDIKISEDVSFESMLLSPKILKGLKEAGFYVPSPIQLHGIPLGKCGFDLLLEAKSGTGKTAVFTVIALEKLNLSKGLQTLMLAPTREIALQISEVIKTIGAYFQGLSVEVVMGGLPFAEDVEKFNKKTVHIVVGSPGRLYHLINQKYIDVSCVRLMVLDEADKLLEKSFLPDINKIFSLLPSLKQMIMSSATYPENMKTILKKYVQNAHHICPDSSSVLLGIEQYVVVIPSHINIVKQTKNRYVQLNEILSKKKFKQCLVFCNYQVRVGEVYKMLNKDKWPADQLHGKQQQTDRLEALKILQEYQCRILVSTDLAARGIDASNVDLVINFEIPYDWQTYLHRIGRAGRFGSYGTAITILCEGDEEKKFRKLLGSINIPFNLKNLWNKEPFPLDITKTVEEGYCREENEPEPKKQVTKFGIKDTDNELRKILSMVSPQSNKKTINDMPTFESLCESFEQVNKDLKINSIESFSDLCTSFQNHEIKGNKHLDNKPVEVNKLIIPCTMFDGNIILQSFENHKKATSLTNTNIIDNIEKKIEEDSVENKIYDSQSSKQESENVINKCQNTVNDFTDNNTKSSKNQENQSHKSKCDESNTTGNLKFYQSEILHVSLPSTSKCSEYKISTKSKANREAKKNENLRLRFGNVDTPNARKVLTTTKMVESKNDFDESVSDVHKSDHDNAGGALTPEYNDSEKALLAANLPTAFGKVKQNKLQSKTNKYFSSSIQNIRFSEDQLSPKNKKVLAKNNVKQKTYSVSESSESEKSGKESFSHLCQSLGAKQPLGHSLKHTHAIPNGNKTVFTKRNVKQKSGFYESSDSAKSEESILLKHRGIKSSQGHTKENNKLLNKSNVKPKADSVYEKTDEESVLLIHRCKKSSRGHNQVATKGSNMVFAKRNVKQRTHSVSESSDSEETEEESVYESSNSNKTKESALLYYGGKKPTKGHRLHHKRNKKVDFESSDDEKVYKSHKNRPKATKKRVSNNNGESDYNLYHANSAKEKQREFNRWYQELQANVRILETFFYFAEMKRLNKNYS